MSGLAQHPPPFVPPAQKRTVSLFVGSISGGITDQYLSRLLGVRLFCIHRGTPLSESRSCPGMRARLVFQAAYHPRK
jgi:hypothetical protein